MNFLPLPRPFAALALLAGLSTAQERDASFALNFGDADLGGRVAMTAYAKTEMQLAPLAASVSAGAKLTGRVRAFGRDVEAASLDASYKVSQSLLFGRSSSVRRSGSAQFKVVLAGFELVNEDDADVVGNLPSLDVFGPNGLQYPIPVGPVVVTVSLNAGVTSSFNLGGDLDVANFAVGVTGSLNAAVNGVARAGVGVPGVSAGVSATLKFFDTTATLGLAASLSGPSGSFTISLRPIRLLLGVYAEVPFLGRYTYTFYDYSMAARSQTYPLQ